MPFKPALFANVTERSELLEKQHLFSYCFGEWLYWIHHDLIGVRVALGEGHVAITDAKDGDYDGPHKKSGGHYNKLAHDVDLFINCNENNPTGDYVSSSEHPMWKVLGEKWESLHPLCRWGGRFSDANHVSVEHNGVK